MTVFEYLFDTSDFPARWNCGNWDAFLGWTHVVSDLATWAAYFAIPISLIYFVRRRNEVPFTWIFILFATFIVACGTVHLIEAIIFWYPIYRISALIKLMTAVVSWVTVIALIRIAPAALKLPSLAETNRQLTEEVRQRKKSERDLNKLKSRYEALIAGTRSIVWTTDAQGGFCTPQISWERYTGQPWNEHKDFGWADALHDDDRPNFLKHWQNARQTGTKCQFTGRLWHQESESFRSIIAEAVPVFDEQQHVTEWVGSISDIEEQYQAESALMVAQTELLRQKRELELIYESSPVGMSLVDRDLKFIRVNRTVAQINGYPPEEHYGKSLSDLLGDLKDQLEPIYLQVIESGEPVLDVEIVGRTPASKKECTWLTSYFPLVTDGGHHTVTAVNAVVQDITDRKKQEERLRESEKRALAASRSKSEFLANMSHEIRTPMAAILGYADVMLEHLKDPDNRNCVNIMKRNGQYLLELINDILDLSRIEAGKLTVDLETCPLPQLVGDIQSLMDVRASEKDIDLQTHFETQVPQTIQTDPIRLRQILFNLIGNAIKFTDNGEVELRVRFVPGPLPRLEFDVIDTGIGISEEQQKRLFKPFSQADASVGRSYGGSGLGLAISKRLIETLQGTLSCESQLGHGSTFRVTLTLNNDELGPLVTPTLEEMQGAHHHKKPKARRLDCRVLVVDDRRDVRHISQHFLENAGATVKTAENGQQAIEEVQSSMENGSAFDLIVMDIQMPVVDGIQATTQLRAQGLEIPIIALTADAMIGDRERCLQSGCDDYLSKPIDHAILVEMVAQYTQDISRRSLMELRQQRTNPSEEDE